MGCSSAGGRPCECLRAIRVSHFDMAERWLLCQGKPDFLFTENETNFVRLFGAANHGPYVKDGINDYIVSGKKNAVNPESSGQKQPLVTGSMSAQGRTRQLSCDSLEF